jgi:TPR repeat protein
VAVNKTDALKWYRLAVELGGANARRWVNIIEAELMCSG